MKSFHTQNVCRFCWKPIMLVYDAHGNDLWVRVLSRNQHGTPTISSVCNWAGGHYPDWDAWMAGWDLDRIIRDTKPNPD